MGKVIHRDLPDDHPLFTGGWSIATVKRPSKKEDKPKQKKTNDSNIKEDEK